MSSNQEHLKNLSEIRSLMERSSSFLSLSGLSGISAGIIGLIASYLMYIRFMPYMDYSGGIILAAEKRTELIIFGILLSAGVLFITFAAAIFFTARKAKKNGFPVWDGSAKRLVVNLFIPLVTGGVFCLILLYHGSDWLVLPSMLLFYGLALINASKYTLHEIRWLGFTEIILGLLALLLLREAIFMWGLGFGVMNIIYGAVMYVKYER